VKCNKDIVECTCPDIEERLKSLMKNSAVAPAAESNLRARIEHSLAKRENKE
jgi:hypothetical protein